MREICRCVLCLQLNSFLSYDVHWDKNPFVSIEYIFAFHRSSNFIFFFCSLCKKQMETDIERKKERNWIEKVYKILYSKHIELQHI